MFLTLFDEYMPTENYDYGIILGMRALLYECINKESRDGGRPRC